MKKRVLALVLVLALFVCLFSVSALAAFDKSGGGVSKDTKQPPHTTFYWLVMDRQIGCKLVDNDHWHGGGEHLGTCSSWSYVEETDTWYFYGYHTMLINTNGLEVFAW